jgi:hypothetical protein
LFIDRIQVTNVMIPWNSRINVPYEQQIRLINRFLDGPQGTVLKDMRVRVPGIITHSIQPGGEFLPLVPDLDVAVEGELRTFKFKLKKASLFKVL